MRETRRHVAPFSGRLFGSIKVGFWIGVVFAVVGTVQVLVGGAERLTANGLSPGLLILMYVGGGVIAGAIVGLLLPVAKRSLLVAMLVGYVAFFPVSLAIAIAVTQQSTVSPFAIAPFTSLTGALAALFYWRLEHPAKEAASNDAP